MNFAILGVFAFKECDWAIASSVQMMVSHGVVSAAMFILVGMLYERHGVRTITYYVGVVALMPKYSFFVIFFTLANAGFPGLANFPAEFGILASVCVTSLAQALFALVGLFLTGVYSFWFVNRIIFGGRYRQNGLVSPVYVDLDFREFFILFQLALLTAVLGIRPDIVLDVINSSV